MNIILYTKEQVKIQDIATGESDPHEHIDYDFGIIAVKPLDVLHTLPM